MTPGATEHVIALKRSTKGEVVVHAPSEVRGTEGTACGLTPDWDLSSWLWLEFRTLNPARALLCKRCWVSE